MKPKKMITVSHIALDFTMSWIFSKIHDNVVATRSLKINNYFVKFKLCYYFFN